MAWHTVESSHSTHFLVVAFTVACFLTWSVGTTFLPMLFCNFPSAVEWTFALPHNSHKSLGCFEYVRSSNLVTVLVSFFRKSQGTFFTSVESLVVVHQLSNLRRHLRSSVCSMDTRAILHIFPVFMATVYIYCSSEGRSAERERY